MTAKRFYVAESNLIDGYCVFDREKKYAFSPKPREADCLNDAHTLNELYEENEQLKSALKELKEIGDYQADRIRELDDENEHIKQTIKTMINTERTQLGQSVLQQLWEAIQ